MAVEGEDVQEVADDISGIPFSSPDASKIIFPGEKDPEKETETEEETADNAENTEEGKEEAESGKEGDDAPAKEEDRGSEQADDDTSGKVEYTFEEFTTSVADMVAKVSNGAIKSIDEIPDILEENARLKEEAAKPKEIPFPNEKAKLVYEHAIKATGLEIQAAGQYIHVMQLDADKLSDKEAQFEAFQLTRPDLSRDKAQKLFDLKYEQRYGELEENLLQQDEHALATREAKDKIKSMQKSYSEAKSTEPGAEDTSVDAERTQAIYKGIDEITSEFEGVAIQYGESPEETLNVPLSSEEASEFKTFLKEPIKLIQKIIADCSKDGVLDIEAWTSEMYSVYKRHEARQESFNLGKTLGQLKIVKETKNAGKKEEKAETAPKTKKSFEDAMLEAVGTR